MATSDRKRLSNQANASLSTGPKTQQGKRAVSANAVRHGLLSQKLILPGESQADFDRLLSGLLQEMRPVGTVEQVLVERIATTMWRQRRLVAAESAQLKLAQCESQSLHVRQVMMAARLGPDDEDMVTDLLANPPDGTEPQALMDELLAATGHETWAELKRKFPAVWQNMCTEANCAHLSAAAQQQALANWAFRVYQTLGNWLQQWRVEQSKLCRAIEVVRWVHECAPLAQQSETVARYQSALDNELFKALRAFREAQSARLRSPVVDAGEL